MHVAGTGCSNSLVLKKSESGTDFNIATGTNSKIGIVDKIRTKKDDSTDGYKLWGDGGIATLTYTTAGTATDIWFNCGTGACPMTEAGGTWLTNKLHEIKVYFH